MLTPVVCACAELEAQTGIAEKTLAEFIVDVAKGARNVDGFKKVWLMALLKQAAAGYLCICPAFGPKAVHGSHIVCTLCSNIDS